MKDTFKENRKKIIFEGMKDGLPIGLGYFAVSFSLGIVAKDAGLNAFQGFIASLFTMASAGEYAVFLMIAAEASYFKVALISLITNARYLLMSCALSQKMTPETGLGHKLLLGADITDELFGIAIARPGKLNPFYSYGAVLLSAPFWATGTALGIIAGNVLPGRIVSALSVALYGMFLAIIIPPAKKDKIILGLVVLSFISSYLLSVIPAFSSIDNGTRTLILTVIISALAAIIFPRKEDENAA